MSLDFQRSESPRAQPTKRVKRVARLALPSQQRAVLDIVVRYFRATGEPCPSTFIARKMNRDASTVREHLAALYAKGWMVTANAPAKPTTY